MLYEVIEIPYKDLPVMKIRPVDSPDAKLRVLHRNLLQPIRQIRDGEDTLMDIGQSHLNHDLNDSEARSCSAEENTGESEESALKGPTTRSMVKGGVRALVNSVQIITGVRTPWEVVYKTVRSWWSPNRK